MLVILDGGASLGQTDFYYCSRKPLFQSLYPITSAARKKMPPPQSSSFFTRDTIAAVIRVANTAWEQIQN
jgi:hypothetical protein